MGSSNFATLPTWRPFKKRKGFASKYKIGLKRHKSLTEEDKISKLPDEILVSILSLLTITEAGRTSIISHRWEKLWMSYSNVLDFDVRKTLVNEPKRLWPLIHDKFLHSTTKFLDGMLLSESSQVSAFTIRFSNWNKYPKRVIDKFVEFSMAKRFQRLEFDFNPKGSCFFSKNCYYFPEKFYDWIKQPCGLNSISSLTSLTLRYINVTGELIEFILSNCPLLERLSVENSQKLTKLNVTGLAALNLKYLFLWGGSIKYLLVSAPSLLSLSVIGEGMKYLHVENVPKLVDVSVSIITYLSSPSLSSCRSQFQTLTFNAVIIKAYDKYTPNVGFSKLKHLILNYSVSDRRSIVGWIASLIEASPFLEKFTHKVTESEDVRRKQAVCNVTSVKRPHHCLKVVEMVGFSGIVNEVELVMYILENAIALEQIIINRCSPYKIGTPFEFQGYGTRGAQLQLQVKEQRAMQLKTFVPSGVDFILI